MKTLTLITRSSAVGRFILPVLTVAIVGNMIMTHQAHATFFAARGETKIASGTDRVTGQVYTPQNTGNHIYVYAGDSVGWRASVWNGGDLGHTTDVTVSNQYYDGSVSDGSSQKPYALEVNGVSYYDRPQEEPLIILGAAGYYYYGYNQSNRNWFPPKVTIDTNGAAPGKTFCQFVGVSVAGYNWVPWLGSYSPLILFTNIGPMTFRDHMACAEIAYNYNLMPSITLNNPDAIQSGGPVSVNPAVSQGPLSAGNPTESQQTQWQITQVIITNGVKPNPNGGTSNQAPCTNRSGYFKPAQGSCTVVAQSTTTVNGGKNTIFNADGSIKSGSNFPTSLPSPGTLPTGAIVCYALSVNAYAPYLTNAVTWRHSTLVCPPDSQKPKVQILGDDLRAGGQIITSRTGGSLATTFGSWAAYASYAGGATNNFATASGLRDGKPTAGLTSASINTLTFANTQATYGQFANASTVLGNAGSIQRYFTPLASASPGLTPGSSVSFTNLAGSLTPYLVNGQLTIQASTIPKGKTIIIVANDTVTIADDITYASDTLNTLSDIPQLVIVAPRITIDARVRQVDAWLVTDLTTGASNDATKYFVNTCTEGGVSPRILSTTNCNTPLIINGPVITSHLYLNRTAGDDTSDSPAETFANRGDAYLWALNYANTSLGLNTTLQTELPPRY